MYFASLSHCDANKPYILASYLEDMVSLQLRQREAAQRKALEEQEAQMKALLAQGDEMMRKEIDQTARMFQASGWRTPGGAYTTPSFES